jgi:hypothetical protein
MEWIVTIATDNLRKQSGAKVCEEYILAMLRECFAGVKET